MESAIHSAEYYQKIGDEKLAEKSFIEAEGDYRKLIDTYAARPYIVAKAMSYIVRCYTSQEKWDDAVDI